MTRYWKWDSNPYKPLSGTGGLRRVWPNQIYKLIKSGDIFTVDEPGNTGKGWIICYKDIELKNAVKESVPMPEGEIKITCNLTEVAAEGLDGQIVHDQYQLDQEKSRLMDAGMKTWAEVDAADQLNHESKQAAIDSRKAVM